MFTHRAFGAIRSFIGRRISSAPQRGFFSITTESKGAVALFSVIIDFQT
jgi:hypothetical protein